MTEFAKLPKRDHVIDLKTAKALTRRYRKTASAQLARAEKAETCAMFPADVMLKLLRQKGCKAFRIYNGENPDGSPALILVGVSADGADMTDGLMIDSHFPCPPFCTPDALL